MQYILTLIICVLLLAVVGIAASASTPSGGVWPAPLSKDILRRVAFLGDSITDGNTYPQLVRDSLIESRGIGMVAMNAGIGGNTMQQMNERLQRDVLDHNPTLVTISAGANDAAKGVTDDQYEASMRSAVATLTAHKIPVILLTNCWWPASSTHHSTTGYDAAIRRIAADYGLRVAEVNRQMSADAASGLREHSLDGHPGYTGQKSIARAVLDAMGYPDIPVVDRVHAVVDKDVIVDWEIRPMAAGEAPLTDAAVATLRPDSAWKTVHLPFTLTDYTGSDVESLAWLDDFRKEGVAIQLNKNVGDGTRFIACTTINSPSSKAAVLQTGAEVVSVWLNGRKVFQQPDIHGWHPGGNSIAIQLNQGANSLVAETGTNFWVRVGDKPMW